MAFTSITPRTVASTGFSQGLRRMLEDTVVVGGRTIDKKSAPGTYMLNLGAFRLSKQSYMRPIPSIFSDEDTTINVLSAIGCTCTYDTQSYSLITTETDKEGIDNPTIFDRKDFKKIKPEKIEATGMFPADTDPFYELDDDVPRAKKDRRKEIEKKAKPYPTALTSDMIKYNVETPSKRTLKYFE